LAVNVLPLTVVVPVTFARPPVKEVVPHDDRVPIVPAVTVAVAPD
jgi:hypothetical protein